MFKRGCSIILVTALLVTLLDFAMETQALTSENDEDFRFYIEEKCDEYGISEALVCSVIECESSWRANAENFDGSCIGLMQINRVHLKELYQALGTTDLYDPYQNAEAGIYMLAEYIKKYEDTDMALMCYNCGESGALSLREKGITGTSYSRKVQKLMEKYIAQETLPPVRACKNIPAMAQSEDEVGDTMNFHICRE